MVCHRPEGLDQLEALPTQQEGSCKCSYRGFKNFFPHGDASTYAHYLFNAFDTEHTGSIKFEDFVTALSILLRGSVREKLQWTFNLYDINHDGYINKEKMDKNRDGVVTLEEFILSCQEDENIMRSLQLFENVI
ncbi:hypothetical protein CRUP_005811 [Coryphaenoides rupestris]|nr:hypothetical protein CRUP_005811 [Coryphaenoides rupestris]